MEHCHIFSPGKQSENIRKIVDVVKDTQWLMNSLHVSI